MRRCTLCHPTDLPVSRRFLHRLGGQDGCQVGVHGGEGFRSDYQLRPVISPRAVYHRRRGQVLGIWERGVGFTLTDRECAMTWLVILSLEHT